MDRRGRAISILLLASTLLWFSKSEAATLEKIRFPYSPRFALVKWRRMVWRVWVWNSSAGVGPWSVEKHSALMQDKNFAKWIVRTKRGDVVNQIRLLVRS